MLDQSGLVLMGVVGSTAYGLDRPGSDEDRIGVFVRPTIDLLGLTPPGNQDHRQTRVSNEPSDVTLHELGKFCSLALRCNPTITELLWLTDYEFIDQSIGGWLVDHRQKFLSKGYVRNAYLGYATQQFRRLVTRGDGSFSADTRKRSAKHSRHLMRLCVQGKQLWDTGELVVRLENPEAYFEFGEKVAAGNYSDASRLIRETGAHFDTADTALPDHPATDFVEDFLISVRIKNLPAA